MCNRRVFLNRVGVAGLALTPLAVLLSACGKSSNWPEGMVPIKWDRDACPRCNMIISDRRFAVEMVGREKNMVIKFDDIGCAVFWMRDKAAQYPWMAEASTRIWVADVHSKEPRWLDARSAWYATKTSPMGYNFGAMPQPEAGASDFQTMSQHVLAKGK